MKKRYSQMKKTNESVDVCRERKKSSLSFKLSYLLGWVKSFGPTSMRVFWREVRRCWTESAKRGFEWACTSPSAIVLVNVSEILTRPLAEKDYRLELLIMTTCWLGTQTSIMKEGRWTVLQRTNKHHKWETRHNWIIDLTSNTQFFEDLHWILSMV